MAKNFWVAKDYSLHHTERHAEQHDELMAKIKLFLHANDLQSNMTEVVVMWETYNNRYVPHVRYYDEAE